MHNNDEPKRGISLTSVLKWRRVMIFALLLFLLYSIWPTLHYESWEKFYIFIHYLINPIVWNLALNEYLLPGLKMHPIACTLELIIILACIWKLIFRGCIIAFFRIKVIVMLALSSYWLHELLYDVIRIQNLDVWNVFATEYFRYSLLLNFLYPIGTERILFAYPILSIFIFSYIISKLSGSIFLGQPLSQQSLKDSELTCVLSAVHPLRRILLPKPKIYISGELSWNAICMGRNIVISYDLFTSTVDPIIPQGVLAHELGHYYHYDITADFICNICVTTFIIPLHLLYIITSLFTFIPVVGIWLSPFEGIAKIIIAFTELCVNLINKVFYFIDGKWSEKSADLFAVDIGFGFGQYMFLYKTTRQTSLFGYLADTHAHPKKRCHYIKNRIIFNWGQEYWDKLLQHYGQNDI